MRKSPYTPMGAYKIYVVCVSLVNQKTIDLKELVEPYYIKNMEWL